MDDLAKTENVEAAKAINAILFESGSQVKAELVKSGALE